MFDRIDQLVELSQSVGHTQSMKVARVARVWEAKLLMNEDEEVLLGTGNTLHEALIELDLRCADVLAEL